VKGFEVNRGPKLMVGRLQIKARRLECDGVATVEAGTTPETMETLAMRILFRARFSFPYKGAGTWVLSRRSPSKGRQARGGTTWMGLSTGALWAGRSRVISGRILLATETVRSSQFTS
jgi:hypothetical protein